MTLLELLLALGLTGVVMVVISMAIHLHLFTLDTGRADIEQAQVARAVLRHIAADIRNAVWYEPLEMSSVASAATTTDSRQPDRAADTTGNQRPGDRQDHRQITGRQPGGDTGDDTDVARADDTSSLDDVERFGAEHRALREHDRHCRHGGAGQRAGLVRQSVRVVGRLQPPAARGPVHRHGGGYDDGGGREHSQRRQDRVLFPADGRQSQSGTPATDGSSRTGLVRREMDRAAASFSSQDGSLDCSEHPGDVLAKEVTYLEFRYYDGSSWYTEWDSDQMGGLPTAIEITISIDPAAGRNQEELDVRAANEVAAADVNEYHVPPGRSPADRASR